MIWSLLSEEEAKWWILTCGDEHLRRLNLFCFLFMSPFNWSIFVEICIIVWIECNSAMNVEDNASDECGNSGRRSMRYRSSGWGEWRRDNGDARVGEEQVTSLWHLHHREHCSNVNYRWLTNNKQGVEKKKENPGEWVHPPHDSPSLYIVVLYCAVLRCVWPALMSVLSLGSNSNAATKWNIAPSNSGRGEREEEGNKRKENTHTTHDREDTQRMSAHETHTQRGETRRGGGRKGGSVCGVSLHFLISSRSSPWENEY